MSAARQPRMIGPAGADDRLTRRRDLAEVLPGAVVAGRMGV
ncbi:MAG: hypothetical protein ACRDO8_01135 [Nocardioidaceae bacterium]